MNSSMVGVWEVCLLQGSLFVNRYGQIWQKSVFPGQNNAQHTNVSTKLHLPNTTTLLNDDRKGSVVYAHNCWSIRFSMRLVRLDQGSWNVFDEHSSGSAPTPFYREGTPNPSAVWGKGPGSRRHTCMLPCSLSSSLSKKHPLPQKRSPSAPDQSQSCPVVMNWIYT